MFIYFIILLVFVIYVIRQKKFRIKFKTFFKKGLKTQRGNFGIYCYDGKQGKGKTYSIVKFLSDNNNVKIFGNLKSIDTNALNLDYTYFEGFEGLLKLRNQKNCIIFYDEIFTALTKSTKLNKEVMDFLSQMRKRNIIFLTTAQEWLEIPMTFRRYCRFRVECNTINLPFVNFSILKKIVYDAELMKWSQLDNEYVAPVVKTMYEKYILDVAESYDTYEQINT